MAHAEQMKFVSLVKDILLGDTTNFRILEIGSYDVSGSIRTIFKSPAQYIGVDLVSGPGVDNVGSGHEISLQSDSFDLSISCECFEHNPYWFETFVNMHRMTKPDGYVVFTCASKGRIEHGTMRTNPLFSPGTQHCGMDYYRNLNESDFIGKINFSGLFSAYKFFYVHTSNDLYFVGIKKGDKSVPVTLELLEEEVKKLYLIQKNLIRSKSFFKRVAFTVYRFPLYLLMNIVSDKSYQNFAVNYNKFFIRISKLFK